MTDLSKCRITSFLRNFVICCAWFAAIVGFMGLVGWRFDIEALRAGFPGLVSIMPNTAVCLVLLAAALWLEACSSRRSPIREWIGTCLAGVVAIVGQLSFLEFWGGWDFGIDQRLFVETAAQSIGSVRPGLMSPVTALSFVILAVGILVLDWRVHSPCSPTQSAALAAGGISVFTLLDFCLKPHAFHAHIALPTVLALLLLSLGLMCARPDAGFVTEILNSVSQHGLKGFWRAAVFDGLSWRGPLRYALAILLVIVGTLLRHLRGTFLPEGLTYITYFPAVMIVAVLGGWGPGIVGTSLAAFCADYFFLPPKGQFGSKSLTDVVGLVLFILIGLGMTWLAGAVERSRKNATQHLRRAAETAGHLAAIVNSSSDAIIGRTPDGTVTSWNTGAEAIFGYSADEMIGRSGAAVVPPHLAGEFRDLLQRMARGEKIQHYETTRVRKDGRSIDISLSISPLKDSDGKLVGFCTISRDITDRKRADKKLQEERLRFESVLESLPVMICLLTPEHKVPFANRAFRKQFGEAQGRKCYEYCFGRSSPCEFCESFQVLDTHAPHEWELAAANGRRIRAFDLPFTDMDGSPLVLEMGIDVTEQRQAEEKLREASRYARSLIEASLDPLVTISREGKITDVNQATEKATGVGREALIGTDFCSYFTQPEKAREGYRQVFAQGSVQDYPLAIRHVSGKLMDVLYNATVFRNAKGEVDGVFAAARDITDRNRAEQALRESEEKFSRTFWSAPVITIVLDIDDNDRLLDVNEAFEKAFGYARKEAIGKTCVEVGFWADPGEWTAARSGILMNGNLRNLEFHFRRKNGENGIGLLSADLVELGGKNCVIATSVDITERKRGEAAVLAERRKFNTILDSVPPYVCLLTPDYHVAFDNREFRTRFGEHQGRKCYEFLFNRTEPCEVCETYKVLTDDQPRSWQWTGPDGRHYDIFDFPFTDTDGSKLILEMGIDVTEREKTESALRQSERAFRTLADMVPQLVWMCTPDGLNAYFNQRWVDYTGLTLQESHGRGWNTPFHPDDKQPASDAWNYAVATGDTYTINARLRAADGGYRWFLIKGVPTRDDSGAIIKWFGTCTDIDDLKHAEEEIRTLNRELEQRVEQRTAQLRESEQRVRRKLDSILSPEGDLGKLELGDILDIPAIQTLLEDFHSVAHVTTALIDLQGKILAVVGWQDICREFHRVHPTCGKFCVESDRELSTGIPEGEFRIYKCKNHMWDVAAPIIIGDKHIGNLFCGQFFYDDEPIDYELFRAQARQYGFDEKRYMAALNGVPRLTREQVNASMTFLARMAKMISQLSYGSIKLARSTEQASRANVELAATNKELEAFTYSVSHDLRAPLRHISGFSKILTEEFASSLPPDAQRHLRRIEDGTRRMGQLVDDLLNLTRIGRQELHRQVTGLESIVKEVIADLKPDCEGRAVEWNIGSLPYVEGDPALLKQVFQNLLSNALKYSRPRAHAIVEIGQMAENGVPVIFVHDNGVGFSMKYADKLFGVFQRLHRQEDFEGTGVGLATVQRIVQKHGGRAWAEAELDKGATFYFTLGPKATEAAKSVSVGESS